MKQERIIQALGNVEPQYVREAAPIEHNKAVQTKIIWGTLAAACLCILLVAIALPKRTPGNASESPENGFYSDSENAQDGFSSDGSGANLPSLVVNGRRFLVSPYLYATDELPEGFTEAGKTDIGGYKDCTYYLNSDVPEWVYVYQEIQTYGDVDETNTLIKVTPHNAYARYVDERLRDRSLVCFNGQYYISQWSVSYLAGDVSKEYYDEMVDKYGIRIEGSAPDGFVSAGMADFSGHDTVPTVNLACNKSANEVYYNPDDPAIVLVRTRWFTAPVGETGETVHDGFDVYILYDCPFGNTENTVQYQGKTFNRSDLSQDTLEWLEWYNGLTEEEQLSISYIPPDLYALCGYPFQSDEEVNAE